MKRCIIFLVFEDVVDHENFEEVNTTQCLEED